MLNTPCLPIGGADSILNFIHIQALVAPLAVAGPVMQIKISKYRPGSNSFRIQRIGKGVGSCKPPWTHTRVWVSITIASSHVKNTKNRNQPNTTCVDSTQERKERKKEEGGVCLTDFLVLWECFPGRLLSRPPPPSASIQISWISLCIAPPLSP